MFPKLKTEMPLYSYAGKNLLFTPNPSSPMLRGHKNEYLSELSCG